MSGFTEVNPKIHSRGQNTGRQHNPLLHSKEQAEGRNRTEEKYRIESKDTDD